MIKHESNKIVKKMMSTVAIFSISISSCLLLGCQENDCSLTDEQNDQIAEYVAGVLIEESDEYGWRYRLAREGASLPAGVNSSLNSNTSSILTNDKTNQNIQNNTNSSSELSTLSESSNVSSNMSSNTALTATEAISKLADVLEIDKSGIKYTRYVVGERYPDKELAICVSAEQDCSVVTLEFEITNNTANEITLNSNGNKIVLELMINGKAVTQNQTLLNNDISNLKNRIITPGNTYTAAAVFQVKESVAADINNMSVNIYANSSNLGKLNIK